MRVEGRLRRVTVGPEEAGSVEFRRLYETAFPKEEQIPYADLQFLMATQPIIYSAWYDGELFVGITIVCEWPNANWFWYFAVCDGLRGRGYGSMILTALMASYENRLLVLDIESPRQVCDNSKQRRRRYGFYLRSGLHGTGVERTFSGISYTVLAAGDVSFTAGDYDRLLDRLRECWNSMPPRESA